MANVQEIYEHVRQMLENRLPYEAFEDWVGDQAWNVQALDDAAARQLIYYIRGQVNGFESGDLNERELREELANAIAPFELRSVCASTETVVWGRKPPQSAISNSDFPVFVRAALAV